MTMASFRQSDWQDTLIPCLHIYTILFGTILFGITVQFTGARPVDCEYSVGGPLNKDCPNLVKDDLLFICLSRNKNCQKPKEYHCAKNKAGVWTEVCAEQKMCEIGTEPFVTEEDDIACRICADPEMFNPTATLSNYFSYCPRKKTKCSPFKNGRSRIECNDLNGNDKYTKDRMCRCNYEDNFRPLYYDFERYNWTCSAYPEKLECYPSPCENTPDGRKQKMGQDYKCHPVSSDVHLQSTPTNSSTGITNKQNETTLTSSTVKLEETSTPLTKIRTTVKEEPDKQNKYKPEPTSEDAIFAIRVILILLSLIGITELIKQSGGTKSNTEPNEDMETHVKRYNDNPVFTSDGSINVEHQLLRSVRRGDYNSLCNILSTISENVSLSEKLFKEALDVSVSLKNREITNRLLNFASQLLKRKSSGQIQDVWPAYEETSEWTPIFVVISYLRYPEEHYLGCRILWRKCDDVSNEGSIVANSAKVRDNPLSYDEMIYMKKLIRTAILFKHHRKIAIVNACPCKSRNGGQDISLEKCIVIYTPIKGFIPFDEQPFPKSIGDVPVDVREAYVKLGMFRRNDRPHHDRQQSHTVNDTDDKSCPTPTPDARYNSSAHRPSLSHIPETNNHNKNTCKQLLPDTALGMDGLYNNNTHDSTANYSSTGSVVNILTSRYDTTAVQNSLQQSSLEEPKEVDENMSTMHEDNTAAAPGPSFFHVNPTLQKSTAMPTYITKTATDEHSSHFMDANTKPVQVLPNRAKTGRDYNEKLLMGTEIGLYGNGLRGTLGAFVPLPNGDVGALTCAHVMGVFHGDCDEDVSQIVTQPSVGTSLDGPSLERFKIGHLYKAVFAPGCCDDVSIDAAIIKVESRRTEKAEFIDTETSRLKTAGFDPSQPPSFTKGQILKFDQLLHYRRNQVIKYGSQSNLTVGVIQNWGSDIKLVNSPGMLPNKTDVEFFNQIEILSVTGCTTFFEGGDSGSLVFMSLDNLPELYCIGLAVGWTSYDACIVTPIESVLKKLGLPDKFIDYSDAYTEILYKRTTY